MLKSNQIVHSDFAPRTGSSDHRLMIFDMDHTGHHAGYIQHLIKYWCEQELPGHLDVVVSQTFVDQHTDVVALLKDQKNARFIAVPQARRQVANSAQLENSLSGRIRRAFREWKLLRKYTSELKTTHCMVMYLDAILLRMAIGSNLPCSFSCIYFRPSFHYPSFKNYVPAGREQLWHWRDQICLQQLLRSRTLETLFCLDPFAVERLNNMDRQKRSVYLQDPVQVYNHSESQLNDLRTQLGIEPNRKVFLLLGVLMPRKGTHEVLEAIQKLPPELCRQITLLFVGPAQPEERVFIEAQVAAITQTHPVQIICQFEFVPDSQVQSYFQISDVILAPYQRHIGMSAILVRSATAQKPVLSSDFGLMGEITRRYHLGLAVDSTSVDEIAQGLTEFLSEPHETLYDANQMKSFADQNKAEEFSSKIFHHLLKTVKGSTR